MPCACKSHACHSTLLLMNADVSSIFEGFGNLAARLLAAQRVTCVPQPLLAAAGTAARHPRPPGTPAPWQICHMRVAALDAATLSWIELLVGDHAAHPRPLLPPVRTTPLCEQTGMHADLDVCFLDVLSCWGMLPSDNENAPAMCTFLHKLISTAHLDNRCQ